MITYIINSYHSEGSFVKDQTIYLDGQDRCKICEERCIRKDCASFYLSRSRLGMKKKPVVRQSLINKKIALTFLK